jgi:hypothetical protein
VQVSGDVEYLVNRTPRGWLVTLLNNRGIYKPQQGLAVVKREESVSVTLALRAGRIVAAREWINDTEVPLTGAQATLVIPAGGLAVVALEERGKTENDE